MSRKPHLRGSSSPHDRTSAPNRSDKTASPKGSKPPTGGGTSKKSWWSCSVLILVALGSVALAVAGVVSAIGGAL